jgi:type II secretion system protein D
LKKGSPVTFIVFLLSLAMAGPLLFPPASEVTAKTPPGQEAYPNAGLMAQADTPAPAEVSSPADPAVDTVDVPPAGTEQQAPPEVKPPGTEKVPSPGMKPEELSQPRSVPVVPGEPRKQRTTRQISSTSSGAPVSFFFDDADILDVIQTVFADILKVNYVIDQKVKGRVTFRTVTPIPREEVLSVMTIILRLNGVGFVEEKGLYRILPLTEVPNELVAAQEGKDPEKVAIELFTFKNLNMKESMQDIENAIGLGSQGGKIRIIPIARLNAIMVVASTKERMEYVRKWVEAFDTMFAYARPKVMVYPLQNSKASNVSSILQSILSGGTGAAAPSAVPSPAPRTTPPGQTPASGAAAPSPAAPSPAQRAGAAVSVSGSGYLISPDTKIFADEINNTLVILSTPADYAFLEETIRKIDTVQRQVVIEALIVRVDLQDNLSFGFSWSFGTETNISGIWPFKNPINLGGDVNINSPSTAAANLSPQGFTYVGKDPTGSIRVVLTALATENKAKVLASPHILVSDNREARIQVGQQVPLATSTTTTPLTGGTVPTNTSTSTIQYKDIGIILKVKPQINDSGLVSLELSQEVSSLGANIKIAGQEFASINKEEVSTNLVALDGETIIIGGLIREDANKSKDGIPFLSKIPILGNLFGTTTDNITRNEIIVLLTPHVMKTLVEAGRVTSDYLERYQGTSSKDLAVDEFIKERSKSSGDAGTKNPR